ncbi:efflux RND transporter periplasmic adaptor subunit [Pseudomonas cichorii]|uniref:MexE family multidrug efflux RND transporter periplasmic adaptor subunit n=1 Tax=Pseudomonas cichorii TaxID=36746 RepID=A0ABQ1DHR2_PSECI|nr:efflux RND transporter periplasmic adaptor subunit [Pseudomonas cichorii]QVE19150.1 efflux RND transporter periplasmic adaptor subunit [Pseudomonas cichorii]GFM90428.1 MexE family multidrug efflux RND transporter periplasmic adaptor subunit [Pseudomonas cichorii]SDN54084.1 membrane fusion protein, multidrug efflux system [Pseudomonas cichorii]
MSIRVARVPRLLLFIALASSAGIAVWYTPMLSGSSTPPAAAAAPVAVAMMQVKKNTIRTWDDFSGRLEAVDRVLIRPQVAGQIKEIRFQEGQLVKQGDVLLTIDAAVYAAAVAQAEAQVASARARKLYTSGEAERARKLWPARAIAQNILEQRENEALEADAQLKAAQANLRLAQINLGYTEVRAPISGRIGRREVTTGNLVAAGPEGPVLTTLVSVDPIYLSFDADEQAVVRALDTFSQRDQLANVPVRVTGQGFQATEGRLQLLDNQIDPQSGTVRMRAVLANPDGQLVPGQFARLQMGQVQAREAILVEERSIGTDQDRRYVLILDDQNKVSYRQISLGARVDTQRIVTSGLAEGDRIIVDGMQRVRPGALVTPQPVIDNGSSLASNKI